MPDVEDITRAAEIASLDETWSQYTNYRLGVSIKFPKEMATFRGSCYWNEEQGSYRPQMAVVPVQIFEETDAVYIAPEHYFELAGERVEENTAYYDECNQITNSLELLQDPERFQEPFWKLVTQEVRNERELDGFIKERYGSECGLGEQTPSFQDGVYDVKPACNLGGGTVVKYYPAGNKVVAWNTGQAGTFPADVNYSVYHDMEMIASFQFLTVEPPSTEPSSEVPAPTPVEEEEVTRAAEIISLDETWNQYTNYRLNFTIRFPKEMAAMLGSCYWNEEQGSYRPEMAFVPVQVFEDADAVYIAPEHYFELAGERVDGGTHYYDECNQITNSLELLRDHDIPMLQFWKLVVQEVRDEGELEDFIKARYGSGCSLGEQVASAQEGVFDVKILGDGKDLAVSQCPMNYGYVLKYFPSGGRVIAWNTGQAYTFLSTVDWSAGYDFEMIESFQFLTETPTVPSTDSTEPDAGWASYVNTDYGFSFQYPADWTMETFPGGPLDVETADGNQVTQAEAVVLSKDNLDIVFQFLRMSDGPFMNYRFAGVINEWTSMESRTIMGAEASRFISMHEGATKAISANVAVPDADLVLLVTLSERVAIEGDYLDIPGAEAIPDSTVALLDQILDSLAPAQ
jgi:hypothetical protein